MNKTKIFPIQLQPNFIETIIQNFPGKISSFPGTYLGLPLHTRKLRKIEVQPLIDKIGTRLPGWKGKFLSTSGRETLVKTMLSAVPIYHLTVFKRISGWSEVLNESVEAFYGAGKLRTKCVEGTHLSIGQPPTAPRKKWGWGSWIWRDLLER